MGITQMHYVTQRAEEAGILCVPHSPWSAPVVAAHLHILSTVSNGTMVEYPGWEALKERPTYQITRMSHYDIIEQPLILRDGYLELPSSPGLGLGNYISEALLKLESVVSQGD